MKRWLIAARPKTLPASFASVIVGASIAYADGNFSTINTILAFLCALLFQIGSNYVNDLYDYLKGADKDRKSGPTRAVSSGLISPTEMKKAIFIIFVVAFIIGLKLVFDKGILVLIIGMLSIVFAIAYTAGPFPLAYNGLGDLFVFIFFGLVGVNGTYYVNAGSFSLIAFISSAIIGLLVANILVVNNYRDYEEDKQSSKKTLVVRLGKKFGIVQYIFSLVASYILLIMLFLRTNNLFILLPFVLSPFGIGLVLQIFKLEGSNLNNTLSLTALFAFAFSILLSTGFVII